MDPFVQAGASLAAPSPWIGSGMVAANLGQTRVLAGLALNDEAEIERQIRGYLAAHPDACDTIEGIVEWWLLEQRIQVTGEKVAVALRRLLDKNVVREIHAPDGRIHYCLKKPGKPRRGPEVGDF